MIVRLRTLLRVSSGSKYMFCYTYTLPLPGVDATHGRRMSTTPDPIPRTAFPFPPAPRTTGRLQRTALRVFHKRRQTKDEHRAHCDRPSGSQSNPGVEVGAAGARVLRAGAAEVGAPPPNMADIMSANGLACWERGGGIAKYNSAISMSACKHECQGVRCEFNADEIARAGASGCGREEKNQRHLNKVRQLLTLCRIAIARGGHLSTLIR